MERPPVRDSSICLTEIEEPLPRDCDQMYWGRQLDRLALGAANEHLGEVGVMFD